MQYASPLKLDYHFNNCNTASGDTSIFVTAAVSDSVNYSTSLYHYV